jgi:hypothetical protein
MSPYREFPTAGSKVHRRLSPPSKSTKLTFIFRILLVEYFLREESLRLPVAKVTRKGPDQRRDFMTVLIFRAVDFDDRLGIADQRLRGSLHDSRFS